MPKNVPKTDLTACFASLFEDNSPKAAPNNGPIIMPGMLKINIPKTDPKKAPITPPLLALYFFAPKRGMKKSKRETNNVSPKNTKTVFNEIFSKSVFAAKMEKPSSARGAPGRNCRITPSKPISIIARQIINNIVISIMAI